MMNNTSRRCYTEYVEHMIRFFLRYPVYVTSELPSPIDYMNWQTVQNVWCNLDEKDQTLLREIYTTRGADFKSIVKRTAEAHDLNESDLWKLTSWFSRKVAEMRGLI